MERSAMTDFSGTLLSGESLTNLVDGLARDAIGRLRLLHQNAFLYRICGLKGTVQETIMSITHNPATITYEQVMALFQETDRRMKETDRQMKETDRRMKETEQRMKETDRQMKETDRKIAKLGDRLGELVAAMVEGGIKRMFKKLGYEFDVLNPEYEFGNKKIGFGEVDILLENGEYALLVEVKTNLTVKDVKEHQERLKKFRLWTAPKGDNRKFLAAVGGGVVKKNVQEFALKQGMFVVQQSGENVEILVPKGEPAVW